MSSISQSAPGAQSPFTSITPLFYAHHHLPLTEVTLPEALPVLAVQPVAPGIGQACYYLVLVVWPGGRLGSEPERAFLVCSGSSCAVHRCTRATSTAPAGAHEAEYPGGAR